MAVNCLCRTTGMAGDMNHEQYEILMKDKPFRELTLYQQIIRECHNIDVSELKCLGCRHKGYSSKLFFGSCRDDFDFNNPKSCYMFCFTRDRLEVAFIVHENGDKVQVFNIYN